MDARSQKAFEFAVDATKQLLTLSAAILALTIAVATDLDVGRPGLLQAGWVAFLISIVCGIWALYALMREMDPSKRLQDEPPSLAASGVRAPALTQIGAFVIGTSFLILFGSTAV